MLLNTEPLLLSVCTVLSADGCSDFYGKPAHFQLLRERFKLIREVLVINYIKYRVTGIKGHMCQILY